MSKEINLLYGPPGSGKTTVAKEASTQMSIEYLSVGDITRKEIQSGSPRGLELKHCLDEVTEYPVGLIAGLMEEHILKAQQEGKRFVLDGYPKYPREAEAFAAFLEAHNQRIESIVVLHIPLEDALARVQNRRICDECLGQFNTTQPMPSEHVSCSGVLVIREDDTEPIFTRRYGDFETSIAETVRILAPYTENVFNVNANTEKSEVVQSVVSALNTGVDTDNSACAGDQNIYHVHPVLNGIHVS